MPVPRSVASTRESAQIQAQQPFGLGHKRLANLSNGELEPQALDHAQEQSHCVGGPNTFRDGALGLGAFDETGDSHLVVPVNLREAFLQWDIATANDPRTRVLPMQGGAQPIARVPGTYDRAPRARALLSWRPGRFPPSDLAASPSPQARWLPSWESAGKWQAGSRRSHRRTRSPSDIISI